jgi:hypothetical protein
MAHLVVILGAGASRACSPRGGQERFLPPLTADLFDARYADILRNYPLGEAAAADIRVVVDSGAIAIERFLRERLRESPDPYARRRYVQIPLYLQELLTEVSYHYTAQPDNFDRLINAALSLESVLFVTLNYDVILDQRLALQGGDIRSMDDYAREDRNWALIKLHGSVNWARAVNVPGLKSVTVDSRMAIAFAELGEELEQAIDPEIHLRQIADMQEFRYDAKIPILFFPALSAPLGSEDELVCPPSHVEFLSQKLRSADGLNLLVIGYSGLDQEVLRLLADSNNAVRSLLVINHDPESGRETSTRIMEQFRVEAPGPGASNQDFNHWAQSSELDDYFDGLE